jgi:hypothetical protein
MAVKNIRVVAVTALAMVFVVMLTVFFGDATHGPTEFNRSVWLRAEITSDYPRLRMADGLLKSGMLLG